MTDRLEVQVSRPTAIERAISRMLEREDLPEAKRELLLQILEEIEASRRQG